jgi:hypothetical protein
VQCLLQRLDRLLTTKGTKKQTPTSNLSEHIVNTILNRLASIVKYRLDAP